MKIRAYTKIVYMIFVTIWYVAIILFRQIFRGKNIEHRFRIRQRWAKSVIKFCNIQIDFSGTLPKRSALLISNHRSFTDPLIQLCFVHALPVAKAEIAKYPIIGKAADLTGIIFLDRTSQNSRADTRRIIKEKIQAGFNVLLYPEGTVGIKEQTKTFSKGSFEIAAEENLPIVPLAIEYGHPDNLWSPDNTILQHFIKSLGRKKIKVKLYIGESIIAENSWSLLRETQDWINEKLTLAQSSWSKIDKIAHE